MYIKKIYIAYLLQQRYNSKIIIFTKKREL